MIAIVPAYNEEPTVGTVVRTLLRSNVFEAVIVVDDGSNDMTSQEARIAGAQVVRTPQNCGKGGAMFYAYEQFPEDRVGFFDADLLGLAVDHVRRLGYASDLGYDMVCGYRDKGRVQDVLQISLMPLITGERILKSWVLDELPRNCWSGYKIETAMNDVVQRGGGKTALIQMHGCGIRTKGDKVGLIEGIRGHWRMFEEMELAQDALDATGGGACET